jgi:hypothetical protein
MTILQHATTKGNLGAINVRTRAAGPQHTPTEGSIGPPRISTQDNHDALYKSTLRTELQLRSLTLSDILEDPGYSDRAKRLAAYLDGRCKADGKWAAWPSVPTIASDLGWDGTEHGGRRRVQRGFEELIAGGVLGRMRLGELAEWFEAEGESKGLAWPKELRRKGRLSAMVCILGWKMSGNCPTSTVGCDSEVAPGDPAKQPKAPKLPGCDTKVAPNATELSHPTATLVSHPSLNVRSLNSETELRPNVANGSALAEGDEGSPPVGDPMPAGEIRPLAIVEETGAVKVSPTVVWTPRELAERFFRRLRDRGLILKVDHDPEKGEVIRTSRTSEHVEVIRPEEVAELLRLRPHILAFLKGEAVPVASAAAGRNDGVAKPAGRVPDAAKAQVRALVGRLAGNSDPAIEATTCRAIADALGDHKPESMNLFLGLAGGVRRGRLGEACLQDAFEAACGRKVENRGKMFTAMVKRWKHSARSGAILPVRRSP